MEEYINVFIGNDKLLVKNNKSFKDLRLKILNEKKRLIKYFSFGDKKINENILIKNFPNFKVAMDKNIFKEFKYGQYRCRRCRKYLKLSNLTCSHSNICRTLYNFRKKESTNEIVDGGYDDGENSQSNLFNECEEDEDDFDERINSIFEKNKFINKKRMTERINEILAKANHINLFENFEIKQIK